MISLLLHSFYLEATAILRIVGRRCSLCHIICLQSLVWFGQFILNIILEHFVKFRHFKRTWNCILFYNLNLNGLNSTFKVSRITVHLHSGSEIDTFQVSITLWIRALSVESGFKWKSVWDLRISTKSWFVSWYSPNQGQFRLFLTGPAKWNLIQLQV